MPDTFPVEWADAVAFTKAYDEAQDRIRRLESENAALRNTVRALLASCRAARTSGTSPG